MRTAKARKAPTQAFEFTMLLVRFVRHPDIWSKRRTQARASRRRTSGAESSGAESSDAEPWDRKAGSGRHAPWVQRATGPEGNGDEPSAAPKAEGGADRNPGSGRGVRTRTVTARTERSGTLGPDAGSGRRVWTQGPDVRGRTDALPPEYPTLVAQPADRYLQICLLRLS